VLKKTLSFRALNTILLGFVFFRDSLKLWAYDLGLEVRMKSLFVVALFLSAPAFASYQLSADGQTLVETESGRVWTKLCAKHEGAVCLYDVFMPVDVLGVTATLDEVKQRSGYKKKEDKFDPATYADEVEAELAAGA
jgi:hypothetical protein